MATQTGPEIVEERGGVTRRGLLRAAAGLLALGGAGLLGAGAWRLGSERSSQADYAALATRVAPRRAEAAVVVRDDRVSEAKRPDEEPGAPADEPAAEPAAEEPAQAQVDWESLRAINGDVAAWCRVGGTIVDVPVVQAWDRGWEQWWLEHDLWGSWSRLGCACVDSRCRADDLHCLAFGHHVTTSPEAMFSPLFDMWEPGRFATLGELEWSTPDGGTRRLTPLCAANVPEDDATVQTFGLPAVESLREWLARHAARCGAAAGGWEALARRATSAVTLVTCSSLAAGQPWRTCVTFVDAPGGGAP